MPITAPASELQKNFGCYQDLALTSETVRVTNYGGETVYVVSAKAFHELKRGQRQAVGTADITKAEVALIEAAAHRSSLDDERSGPVPPLEPQPGLVIGNSYLFQGEKQDGGKEGHGDRPCEIVVVTGDEDSDTLVCAVPVTTQSPHDNYAHAVELPQAAKRRLGLDSARSWTVTSELNRFIWPDYNLGQYPGTGSTSSHPGLLPIEIFAAAKGDRPGQAFKTPHDRCARMRAETRSPGA